MAMVLKKQLNFDVCDLINKFALKTHRDEMKWEYFERVISDGERKQYDNIVDFFEIASVPYYSTFDTKEKRDGICRVIWVAFTSTIEEYEWKSYRDTLIADKDRMFKIIEKYFQLNFYVHKEDAYFKELLASNMIKFKKNGEIDKRCKAYSRHYIVESSIHHFEKSSKTNKFYYTKGQYFRVNCHYDEDWKIDEDCYEDWEYELPKDEWSEDQDDEWC